MVYQGSAYPAMYRGRYFFGDYVHHQLFTLAYNDSGELVTPPEPGGFATDIGLPVKFATMPTGGDIVYADIGTGKLRRLVYAPGNNPPTAVITSTVDPDTHTVILDATTSTDPNGDALTYRWDFGDGSPVATGPVVTHTYPAQPDNFAVALTATDPLGTTNTATVTVYPGNYAPVLSTQFPSPDTTYAVGDLITASATATDTEDGPVNITWTTVLVHCVDIVYCHDHPGAGQTGSNFQMIFEGHPGDSRLEITATATDTRGATTRQTFIATPRQRLVTILSNTPANFTIGDQQTTSALFTVGMTLTVIAPTAAQDGVATFDRWSDGSTDRVRQLTIPNTDTTFTVSYLTPIDRRYAADPALRATVGTPITAEQGDTTVRWRDYATGRVYWSPPTAVHEVHGGIRAAHVAAGGHYSYGVPTTDELPTPDTQGRYNHFTGGRSIYWTPATNAHLIYGGIRNKWAEYGWERSYVGYPTTDETGTPDGIGRYNHFQRGSIYWTPATNAHLIYGGIHGRWAALGWERSYLGYPTTDEFAIPGGRQSNFQHGYITYNFATGQTIDHRY